MSKKYDIVRIGTALEQAGINIENRHKVAEQRDGFTANSAKVIPFVEYVLDTPEAERRDPSAVLPPLETERYRKRAVAMFDQFTAAANAQENNQEKGADAVDAKPGNADNGGTSSVSTPTDGTTPEADNQSGTTGRSRKGNNMATKKKAAKKQATTTANKGPGVIDTIVSVLAAGTYTAQEIADKVATKTGRKADKVLSTVKIQMTRLTQPKKDGGRGLKIKRIKQEGTNVLKYTTK